jgi:hypothetical protein
LHDEPLPVIGVAIDRNDLAIAEEFFELFKTPWEPAVPGRRYPAIISTNGRIEDVDSDVLLLFGAKEHAFDITADVAVEVLSGPVEIGADGQRFPIYGDLARFGAASDSATLTSGGKAIEYRRSCGKRTIWRVGYNLFSEARYLLRVGQPATFAEMPTFEHHIEVLRRVLVASGVPFVEVPPRPAGFEFACCLTHDVDFFGIRRHAFDRTLAGFIARASVGSLADFVRGRRPFLELVRNWAALVRLPAVFTRMASDFWHPFADYALADAGLPSTFFLVPFKGRPGMSPQGGVRPSRAVPYEISDIADDVKGVAERGSELAVHGIDAWCDADAGRAERAQLTSVTGQRRAGVRMHWLYFNQDSPRKLETAGFDYDSTYGYNDAVGYRAGTSQVFRIPGTRLMELPLSIMDSAMFFSDRMALSRDDARERCQRILTNARRFGGTVVINWHDRSLVPERQWGRPYADLLGAVRDGNRAWFCTGTQAVDWFDWRRSMKFACDERGDVSIVSPVCDPSLPAAQMTICRPGKTLETHTIRSNASLRAHL